MELNEHDRIIILFSIIDQGYDNILVNISEGHRKYWCYKRDQSKAQIVAYYGRIGGTPQSTTYPSYKEYAKENEKFNKGYRNITIDNILRGRA
jgi:hypothetical protein